MDTEITLLKPGASYNFLKCYEHGKNTVYEFDQVLIENNEFTKKNILNGTYMLLTNSGHYFHFLKEYVGSYLYYKKHIDDNLKILWVEADWQAPDFHDTNQPIEKCFEMLKVDCPEIIKISLGEFITQNFKIEKLAVIADPGWMILNRSFPPYEQSLNGCNKELREFIKPLMIEDLLKPKKIFISRKKVSESLREKKDFKSISRYNPEWLEKAIEDFFKIRGYTIIELSGMTIEDQVSYFYNADYVAGQMGAGLINGIFSKDGTKFVCIKTHKWFHYPYDEDIWQVINAEYEYAELYDKKDYTEAFSSLYDQLKFTDLGYN